MILTNRLVPAAIMLMLLSFMSVATAGAAVHVDAPWIREAPPASTVLAGYMVLRNSGDTARTVTHIDSPDFKNSQIHRTVMEDGMAKMLPVEELQLPVHSSVSLEPGGLHLMLFDPLRDMHDGDIVTLVIHYANGESHTVQAPVLRKTGEHNHAHHH